MLNITYYFCVDIITVYCKSLTLAFEQISVTIFIILFFRNKIKAKYMSIICKRKY